MRSLAVAITLVAAEIVMTIVGCSSAHAQTDEPANSSFLEFATPCKDPLPEPTSPKLLDTSRTGPKGRPESPLTPPVYPNISRCLGEEGVAVMRLLVDDSGEVNRAEIVQSTGSPSLDTAALENTRSLAARWPGSGRASAARCLPRSSRSSS